MRVAPNCPLTGSCLPPLSLSDEDAAEKAALISGVDERPAVIDVVGDDQLDGGGGGGGGLVDLDQGGGAGALSECLPCAQPMLVRHAQRRRQQW